MYAANFLLLTMFLWVCSQISHIALTSLHFQDSLSVEFGVSALKGISVNEHITDFVLYDYGRRDQVLQNILGRLSTDVQSRFTTGEYTDVDGDTHPCIRFSASGEY